MGKNSENLEMNNEIQAGFTIIEKNEKNDYSARGLKDLEVTEPIIMANDDVFNESERIKAKNVKAHNAFFVSSFCEAEDVEVENSAFYWAHWCRVKNIKGRELFDEANRCLITGDIKATSDCLSENSNNHLLASVGDKSRGVVLLGENLGEERIFPSVIRMKGRVEDDAIKVEEFFKSEFEKDRKGGEENVFNYLKWFDWEGKTLEEGRKNLKERYVKFKEMLYESFKEHATEGEKDYYREMFPRLFNQVLDSTGIEESYFYYLINNNSKRQEIFQGFEKLRKVEKKSLVELNNYIPKLQSAGESLSLLSMGDWLKLSEYAEFLDFEDREVERIKSEVNNIELGDIMERPDDYKKWKVGKFIKQYEYKKKRLNTGELVEEFEKEKKNKINVKIKEYILGSPENNLNEYLKKIGFENEKKEGLIFAARLHKVLENKKEENNKNILLELMKGKQPVEFDANKIWLEEKSFKKKDEESGVIEGSGKIDTEKWLKHKKKEYATDVSGDYFLSSEKAQKSQIEEINKHFEEAGLGVTARNIEEAEKIFLGIEEKISADIKKDIKNHIQTYKSLSGIEQSKLPGKIILETEEDPLEVIQMGEKVIGSCLKIRGGHEESAVCNAADVNKKIIWAKNEKKEVLGRRLVGVTRNGELASFRIFNNDPRIDLDKCYKDFVFELAEDIKTKVTDSGKIEQLVGENWYDDGIVDMEKQ